MYQRLLNDPDKAETLSDELKEKIEHVNKEKQKNPKFRIWHYDWNMLEFYFCATAPTNPYRNIHLIRDKETGEPVVLGPIFHDFLTRPDHDEDVDELLVKLPEELRKLMENYSSKDVLRRKCRMNVKICVCTCLKSILGEKLDPLTIRIITDDFAIWIEKMKLAEERYRIKKYLWRLRAKGKFSYGNSKVTRACFKLSSVDGAIYHGLSLPTEEESWASVPLEERSDFVKLEAKLNAEYQLILREIEASVSFIDYLKQKK